MTINFNISYAQSTIDYMGAQKQKLWIKYKKYLKDD